MLRLSTAGVRGSLRAFVRCHSHGSGHSHSHGANSYLQTTNLRDPGVRITWIGLLANVGMAAGKGAGGVIFHSQSLIADAIHAVSDLVSDFLTLATVSVAKKPVTKAFPNGFGRIETMGAFGVSALLLVAGTSMGYSSILTISEFALGAESTFVHYFSMLPLGHHDHGQPLQMAEWSAMWIALASIGIKEALFQATNRIGKKQNSQVLIANAWHHRVDCLASAVSAVSIAGGQLMGLTWLDPFGGLIISGMIIKAGIAPLKQAVSELAGNTTVANASDTQQRVNDEATFLVGRLLPGWELEKVLLEQYGSNYVATVFITSPAHRAELDTEAAAELRKELHKISLVKQVYLSIC